MCGCCAAFSFLLLSFPARQAWLGFYNSHLRKLGWDKPQLVRTANELAQCWGYSHQPPALQRKTVGKMGLKGVPGLHVE